MQPNLINNIFVRLQKNRPNPETELNFTNTFTLLLAVILSAQATDKSVNNITKHLFKLVKTPQDIIELGMTNLKGQIRSIGLFNSKASNIFKMSKILVGQFGGVVPNNRANLEKLPGVGPKTASVVLNIAFGHNTIAVDTHVFRVANRIGLVKTKTPKETEKILTKIVPDIWKRNAHHWLILHGRYVCKSRNPLCNQCIIMDLCNYALKELRIEKGEKRSRK